MYYYFNLIRQVFACAALCVLLFACSKNNIYEHSHDIPVARGKLTIHTNVKEGNIFEPIQISVSRNGDSSFMYNFFPSGTMAYLNEYDSVILNIPGVLRQVSTRDHFTLSQSQVFIFPGRYSIYLIAFKNDKISSADTTEVFINNRNDFLNINWKTTKSSDTGTTYSLEDGNELLLTYRSEYARLGIWAQKDWDKISNIELYEKTKKILYDYIVKLYGRPYNIFEGEDFKNTNLKDKFSALFTYKNEKAYPIAIWRTATSSIALLTISGDDTRYDYHFPNVIIAEPVKN